MRSVRIKKSADYLQNFLSLTVGQLPAQLTPSWIPQLLSSDQKYSILPLLSENLPQQKSFSGPMDGVAYLLSTNRLTTTARSANIPNNIFCVIILTSVGFLSFCVNKNYA